MADRQTSLTHTPQRFWVFFEVNNDCIVHTVHEAEHMRMSDMIGARGN